VTQPDRPAGRGQRLAPSPVKRSALECGLPVFTPERLRDEEAMLTALQPDLFIVVSYGKIIPAPLLAIPKRIALNVHPSLLPLYRGATPLQGALRDGCAETGVTIIAMDAGLDTGDIVRQEPTSILPDETYGELHDRLAVAGARLLENAIGDVARGTFERRPQAGLASEARIAATMTRPLRKEDLVLRWDMPADAIVHRVRAYAPQPAARASVAGTMLKIVQAHARRSPADPANAGEIAGVDGTALLVYARDGCVALERVIPPNRGQIDGASFARSLQPAR
jgi:methionyl-tRNA formyltransferase